MISDVFSLPSPIGLSHDELLDILLEEEYGHLPTGERAFCVEEISRDESFLAGKANLVKLAFTMKGSFGEYTFPLYEVVPNDGKEHPAFLHINFRDLVPDRYQPTEELVDNGYAVFTFCYKDVTSDDGDFTNGLAGVIYQGGERSEKDAGKIALWAYTATFVMDYILTRVEVDKEHISVIGHSRLGKTALLAGALDSRFYCAISNDSGCSGAAISRGKSGETIADICRVFPYWFSEHYKMYVNNENAQPFDQHFLLAANAPHRVYVASATEDDWACPPHEYASACLVSPYYEGLGLSGFVGADKEAIVGKCYHDGRVGYHLRPGRHYQSREDWLKVMAYLQKQYSMD